MKYSVEVCMGPDLARGPYLLRGVGRQMRGDSPNRPGRTDKWWGIFPTGRGSTRGDFSNGPGRQKRKSFNGRAGLQKKEDE